LQDGSSATRSRVVYSPRELHYSVAGSRASYILSCPQSPWRIPTASTAFAGTAFAQISRLKMKRQNCSETQHTNRRHYNPAASQHHKMASLAGVARSSYLARKPILNTW